MKSRMTTLPSRSADFAACHQYQSTQAGAFEETAGSAANTAGKKGERLGSANNSTAPANRTAMPRRRIGKFSVVILMKICASVEFTPLLFLW